MASILERIDRVPPSKRILYFLGGLAVIVAAWYFLLYQPMTDKIAKLAKDKVSRQNAVAALEKRKENLLQLKREIDELRAQANVTVVLPDSAALPALWETLQSDATLAGVRIVKWKNEPEAPFAPGATAADFAPKPGAPPGAPGGAPQILAIKVPVSITILGTFHQINRYFYALHGNANSAGGQDKRLISIEQLVIVPADTTGAGSDILQASFIAATFRRPDGQMTGSAPGGQPMGVSGKTNLKAAAAAGAKRGDVSESVEK